MKERERRRPGEPSLGDAGLTPGKGEREGRRVGRRNLKLQCSSEKVSAKLKLTGAPKQDAIVCSGCYRKTPQTGGLYNGILSLTVLEAGKSKIKVPAGLVSGESSFLGL